MLVECNISELNEKEKYYILKYKTTDPRYGYNISFGGGGKGNLTLEKIEEITNRLRTTSDSQSVIAKDFDISTEMVQGINTGRY